MKEHFQLLALNCGIACHKQPSVIPFQRQIQNPFLFPLAHELSSCRCLITLDFIVFVF